MKLCLIPSGLSQTLSCEVTAAQQKHYEIFTLMQACFAEPPKHSSF